MGCSNKTGGKIRGLKTSYLGDAYVHQKNPAQTFDFLKKTSLYADTSIIKDSIVSELLAFQQRKTGEVPSFSIITQYALNMMKIEELFSSDLDRPICILAPSSYLSLEKKGVRESIDELMNDKIVPLYASELFGRKFDSAEELINYLERFNTFKEFYSALDQSTFPFQNPDGVTVDEEKFLSVKNYYEEKYATSFSFSESLFLLIRGRYSWVPYDLISTSNLTSNYVTDFRGLWNNYLNFLKKDNELLSEYLSKKAVSKNTLIMQALQQQEFNWLGDIPLDKIKTLRERGELGEMREILGKNFEEIKNVKDADFVDLVSQINYSLNECFKKHSCEVKHLDKIYRMKYTINISTLVVSGSLAIAAALYPPIASIASLTSKIGGSYSVVNLIRDFFDKKDKYKSLQQKPIAMLFDVKKTESNV